MSSTSAIKSNNQSVEEVKLSIDHFVRSTAWNDREVVYIAMRELMDEYGHGPETELEAVLDAMTPERREGMLELLKNLCLKYIKEMGFK